MNKSVFIIINISPKGDILNSNTIKHLGSVEYLNESKGASC